MGVWCIVIISVIIGAKANEQHPNNPPYLLEELKATAESRVLARVEHLLQNLSAKIKVLDDGIDEMKRDINSLYLAQNDSIKHVENVSEQLKNFSISATERMLNLEHKLEPLPQIIRETNEMIKTTNELFTQRMTILDQKIEQSLRQTGGLTQPDPSNNITFEVFRDLTHYPGFGSNWIVFQRRFNGSVNFFRNWTEYKQGFGDIRGEHWLGLDKLHSIVKTRRHELLIELENFDGVIKYAHYDDFKIGDENEKYIIKSVGNYTGTAGDSFTRHKGYEFSTYDQDNDKRSDNCSRNHQGAWWFTDCGYSHLNGKYLKTSFSLIDEGIFWSTFEGFFSLKSSKMMVRPFT